MVLAKYCHTSVSMWCWQNIATPVSACGVGKVSPACGVVARSAADVSKKWIDLKRVALKANSASNQRKTGHHHHELGLWTMCSTSWASDKSG